MNDKIKTFIPWDKIEESAQGQIENTSELPCLFHHVAVMPDCHYGKGATVGTVLPTIGAIVPAAVGVDIGCGMIAVKTILKKEDLKDLVSFREGIERRIPMSAGKFNNKITDSAQKRIDQLLYLANSNNINLSKYTSRWEESLGTLGGGNHFVEICLDEDGTVWCTLHSGSRGIGNQIGTHHIKVAKNLMKKYFVELKDPDLAYLPEETKEFDEYIKELNWAQQFAKLNRDEMMDRVMKELSYQVYGEDGHQEELEVERINSHHNFAQKERHMGKDVWITRKGAVQAKLGMKGMIPGSMGTKSYIFSGKENVMSFHSSPHGAGRRMSRTEAKKKFTREDMREAMKGIEFRDSEVLIDEIPGAYKDIDEIIEYAKDLIQVDYVLKQIINCKGD